MDINVTVYERPNPGPECTGLFGFLGKVRSWVVLGGYAFTADAWAPFADELFDQAPTNGGLFGGGLHGEGGIVCNVLAIDFPAHGKSGVPLPLGSFTDISFDNYAEIVGNVILRLRADNEYYPKTIAGHSMGAEVIQQMQSKVINDPDIVKPLKRNLLAQFGLRNVVLLAGPPTIEENWSLFDGNPLAYLGFILDPPLGLGFLDTTNAELGDVIQFSPFFFDTNWLLADGTFAENTPFALEPAPEPIVLSKETAGYFDPDLNVQFSRPSLPNETFHPWKGVRVFSVGFSGDTSVTADEAEASHLHLVGNLNRYVTVVGEEEVDEAIHGLPYSDPATVVEALAGLP